MNKSPLPAALLACASFFLAPSTHASEPGAVSARDLVAAPAVSRDQASAAILKRWAPFIEESGTPDLSEWRREMKSLLEAASPESLQRASERLTYPGMMANLKGMVLSDEEALSRAAELSVARGLSDDQAKALGDINRDLVFVPVPACRIVDTRLVGGQIAANSSRGFDVTAVNNYSFQGGASSDCGGVGAAGSFAGALMTIAVPGAASSGFLTAYAFGATQPLVHTLEFPLANATSTTTQVMLDQGSSANEMTVYTSAQTHVVIDVLGYFINPTAPVLECVTTAETSVTLSAGSTGNANAPVCAAGYIETATYCQSSSWQMPFVYVSGGVCSAQNNSGANATLQAARRCCRVPN